MTKPHTQHTSRQGVRAAPYVVGGSAQRTLTCFGVWQRVLKKNSGQRTLTGGVTVES
jgi:hypothetical protein